ncbi:hypothetical protein ACRALDRAFT_1064678 [Sodiomyces alcalophilus JCM 7366]|uniref:uncharacterized protein n=1 Tax=Sodiomyces alcalophilus JCM 7366 TaxID=591952 RepID=UPI0039B42A57
MGDDRPCGSGIPRQIFASKEQGHEALIAHAYSNGYSLTKHQQYPRGGDPTRVTYRCAKGRSYTQRETQTHESKRRRTASQMTGCPFKLNLRRRDSGWVVEYIIQHGGRPLVAHNHGWIQASAFPKFRTQGIAAYKDEIVSMRNSGMRPREIMTRLRNPESPDRQPIAVTTYDIMNLLARYCRDELGGKTPVQWKKGKPRGRSAARKQPGQVEGAHNVEGEAEGVSVDNTNPADPVDPANPADRADPADPAIPSDPAVPADPANPANNAREKESKQDAIMKDAEGAPEIPREDDVHIDDGGGYAAGPTEAIDVRSK